MKKLIILSIFTLGLITLSLGQTYRAEAPKQKTSLKTSSRSGVAQSSNRIVSKNVNYSGVIVQAAKAGNPLQLINPFAPAEAGGGYMNCTFDPVTGKPDGLKLFSIEF